MHSATNRCFLFAILLWSFRADARLAISCRANQRPSRAQLMA